MNKKKVEEPKVFISHAWGKDKLLHGFARQVSKELKRQHVDCFFDEDALVFGDVWTQAVEKTIKDDRFLSLVLLSPDYIRSPNCQREMGLIRTLSASYGKPIIPVLLEKYEDAKSAIGEEIIHADFSSLFKGFLSSKGRHLGDSWKRRLTKKVRELADAIHTQYRDYLHTLHTYRVQVPRGPIMDESLDLYERYPEEHRDPPNRVVSWLYENTVAEVEIRPNEIYLVSTYRGRVVGMLYATHYPGQGRGAPGLCHVHAMVVDPEHATVQEEDRSGSSRASVVAEQLVTKLAEAVKQCDRSCQAFTLELPGRGSREEADVIADCWYAWTTIRREFRTFELKRCSNLTYLQPDVDWSLLAGRRPKALRADLLLLRRPKQGSHIDVERLRAILKIIYWCIYGEAYFDHYSIKEWFEHLADTYSKVLHSIPGSQVSLDAPKYPSG